MNDRIGKQVELDARLSRVLQALLDLRERGKWFKVELEGSSRPGEVSRGNLIQITQRVA